MARPKGCPMVPSVSFRLPRKKKPSCTIYAICSPLAPLSRVNQYGLTGLLFPLCDSLPSPIPPHFSTHPYPGPSCLVACCGWGGCVFPPLPSSPLFVGSGGRPVLCVFIESKSDSLRACVLWYDTACSRSSHSCTWTAYPRDRAQPEKEEKLQGVLVGS